LELQRGRDAELVAWANLTGNPVDLPATLSVGKSLWLSTADQRYGGPRSWNEPLARLEPYELLIWGPQDGRS
jgi:hypothetical protein